MVIKHRCFILELNQPQPVFIASYTSLLWTLHLITPTPNSRSHFKSLNGNNYALFHLWTKAVPVPKQSEIRSMKSVECVSVTWNTQGLQQWKCKFSHCKKKGSRGGNRLYNVLSKGSHPYWSCWGRWEMVLISKLFINFK